MFSLFGSMDNVELMLGGWFEALQMCNVVERLIGGDLYARHHIDVNYSGTCDENQSTRGIQQKKIPLNDFIELKKKTSLTGRIVFNNYIRIIFIQVCIFVVLKLHSNVYSLIIISNHFVLLLCCVWPFSVCVS